jgi:hypothetical protein
MLRKISSILAVLFLWAAGSVSVFAVSVFSNPGFEEPPTILQINRYIDSGTFGWKTTHPLLNYCDGINLCRPIEFWSNGFIVPAPQGVQLVELNVLNPAMVYQQIALVNGDKLTWSFLHRGRENPIVPPSSPFDVAEFRIGIPAGLATGSSPGADSYGIVIARVSTSPTGVFTTPTGAGTITATPAGGGWVRYSGTYTYTGASQTVNIGFFPVSSSSPSYGNLIDDANLEIVHEEGCCDQIKVRPYWVPDVSIDYKTFEIYNVKYPSTDVCSIDIDIRNASNQQPPSGWQGGGLFVNSLVKPVPAWWKLPYNRIPNGTNGMTQIDGHPNFNTAAVKFNLGIDYSTPYTGTVYLTVNHCDGTFCKLNFYNWTPRPPSPIKVAVDDIYPIGFEQELIAVTTKFQPLKGTKGVVKWIVVEALDEDAEVFSIDADSSNKNSTEDADSSNKLIFVSSEKREKIALYELAQPVNLENAINGELNLVLKRKERSSDKPRLKYIFFDEGGSPIGFTSNDGGK